MMYFNPTKKHYYEIENVLNHFKNHEESLNYLLNVIEQSSPDYFHWTDIDAANNLK